MSHNDEHAGNIAALRARPDFAPGLGVEPAAGVATEGNHADQEEQLRAVNAGTAREATEVAARRSREHAARLAAVHEARQSQLAAEDHAAALAAEAAERQAARADQAGEPEHAEW